MFGNKLHFLLLLAIVQIGFADVIIDDYTDAANIDSYEDVEESFSNDVDDYLNLDERRVLDDCSRPIWIPLETHMFNVTIKGATCSEKMCKRRTCTLHKTTIRVPMRFTYDQLRRIKKLIEPEIKINGWLYTSQKFEYDTSCTC